LTTLTEDRRLGKRALAYVYDYPAGLVRRIVRDSRALRAVRARTARRRGRGTGGRGHAVA
jgi:hypothetical protein